MVSRRGVLSAALAGLLAPPAAIRRAMVPRPVGGENLRFLAALTGDAYSAVHVGEAVLRCHPELEDAGRLEASLALRGLSARETTQSLRNARRCYQGVLREDFSAGRVIDCDGWQLAQAEAHLCALVAMGARSA